MFLMSSAHLFFKINVFKKSFGNTIRVSISLDPDQDRHSSGPDLGPNYFCKGYVAASTERVNEVEAKKSPNSLFLYPIGTHFIAFANRADLDQITLLRAV